MNPIGSTELNQCKRFGSGLDPPLVALFSFLFEFFSFFFLSFCFLLFLFRGGADAGESQTHQVWRFNAAGIFNRRVDVAEIVGFGGVPVIRDFVKEDPIHG